MNTVPESKVILDTAYGVIALSLLQLQQAVVEAEQLFGRTKGNADSQQPRRALLDAAQLSELFGVDATWFLTRAREDRIPHLRIGKYVRFDADDVRAFFTEKADRHANS